MIFQIDRSAIAIGRMQALSVASQFLTTVILARFGLFVLIAAPLSAAIAEHTPTPMATEEAADLYKPNNSFSAARQIPPGGAIEGLTLAPPNDQDYFKVYLKAG